MNRATKRMLAKQQAQADREKSRRPQPTARMPVEKDPLRIRFPRFLRECRGELRKVAWPSRGEVATYTMVVLVAVTFVTLIVFGLDFAFGKAVFNLYGR